MKIKIEETETRGRAVVATERLEPGLSGLEVLTERALMVFPTRGSNDGPVPHFLAPNPQLFTDWCNYLQQPKEIQERILNLYTDMECPHANALRDYLHNYRENQYDEEEKMEQYDEETKEQILEDPIESDAVRYIFDHIEEFVQFVMVIRFNSVELQPPAEDGTGPGTNFGHGLFEVACKMNHSCRPNCVWFTTPDGKCKEIRAISTIEEGEELTVDYVGNVLDATPQRREDLLNTKGFVCECDRCAANHDDTRRFKCITHADSKCNGFHFLYQPTYSSKPSLLECSCCGAKADQDYTYKVMKEEIALVGEINEVDEALDTSSIIEFQDRIEGLEPPHEYHSLADKCYQLKGELYSFLGDYRRAAEAYAKCIDCRIAILGNDYYSQATAFACERLGDALNHIDVDEAEVAYKRTVRVLELMRGAAHSDPYVKCAMKKLLTVQNRRIHSSNYPKESCVKGMADTGIARPPATDFPCRLCGNPSMIPSSSRDALSYCCEFHKRMHRAAVRGGCVCIEEEKTWD
mmetsp:Transcript_26723/g.43971  ORF Transcript_26723/g.43971 Transcript_26723/m.43971 type:complete len:521 (-) Transcript_26723:229-1791(-)